MTETLAAFEGGHVPDLRPDATSAAAFHSHRGDA
jgi:hypothetical protein